MSHLGTRGGGGKTGFRSEVLTLFYWTSGAANTVLNEAAVMLTHIWADSCGTVSLNFAVEKCVAAAKL